jgi:hypothetical protein
MSDFMEKWTTAAAKEIAKIVAGAVVAEREECAKIAEELRSREAGHLDVAEVIAAKIRARGNG